METKIVFWLSRFVDNEENSYYIFHMKNDLKLNVEAFKQTNELIKKMEEQSFKMYVVIVSKSLFQEYINGIKNNKNLYSIPLTIIFTGNKASIKEKIDKEYWKYLNHKFFNPLGIVDNFDDLKAKILQPLSEIDKKLGKTILGNSTVPTDYKDSLIFEYIRDKKQLIFPYLYDKIMKKSSVDYDSVKKFNLFLFKNFGEEEDIKNLLKCFFVCEDIPDQMIAKYWGRIYTLETPFYYNINHCLMNLKNQKYNTFIQMFYSGFKDLSFKFGDDNNNDEQKILYRGTIISNKELDKIKNYNDKYKNSSNTLKEAFLVYSRAFLSFSKSKEVALGFMNDNNDNNTVSKILFELKYKEEINITSNVNFERINKNKEEEILFFPFSSFIIKDVTYIEDENYYKIDVVYLGMYKKEIEEVMEEVKDKPELIEQISQSTKFSKDVFNSEIMINRNIEKNIEQSTDINKKENIFNSIEKKISSSIIKMNIENIKEKEEIKMEQNKYIEKSTLREPKIQNDYIKLCLCKTNKPYISNLKEIFNMEIFEYMGLDDIINKLYKVKGQECLLILSEELFPSYLDRIQNFQNINNIPFSVIYTSNAEMLRNNRNYSQYLGNIIYNPLGIVGSYHELKNKIVQTINNLKKKKYKDFQFEYIDNDNEVFLPEVYKDIIARKKIEYDSIQRFNDYLMENYEEIKNNIVNIEGEKNIEEIAKIYARIYTMEMRHKVFYRSLNQELNQLDYEKYETYIKVLYIYLTKFAYRENTLLYRYNYMSTQELNKFLDFYKEKTNKKEDAIIYNHSFKSFNSDKRIALEFKKENSILFQLKYNARIMDKSNIDMKDFSMFGDEKEILFLPFSSFVIENIRKERDGYIVDLKYLGIYKK